MKTKEELFADWLASSAVPSRLSDYFMVIGDIEALAKKKHIIKGSIYEVTDPAVSAKIINAINSDRIFRYEHKKQMRDITEAAQLFHKYTKENQSKNGKTRPKSTPDIKKDFIVDFTKQTAFEHTKPISFSYFGDVFCTTEPTSWKEFYARICRVLIDDYPHVFKILRERSRSGGRDNLVYDERASKQLIAPACIAEGYYVERYQNTSDLIQNIKKLLDLCRVDYENLEIHYCILAKPPLKSNQIKSDDKPAAINISDRDEKAAKTYKTPVHSAAAPKHPCQIEFEAWLKERRTPEASVKTYSHSLKKIGDYLLDNQLEDRHIYSIFGIARLGKIQEKIISDSNKTFSSLDYYALAKYISFRNNSTSKAPNNPLCERYSTLLRDKFENGFRINSMIDRNRFKQYYFDTFGEEIQQSDDELIDVVKQVGFVQDERIFARTGGTRSDILDDIQADIAAAFKGGASCVYVASVFEKYRYSLADQLQIYSEDVLKEQLLATSYGEYNSAKLYFYTRKREPNISADVEEVMRHSQLPLTYEQIHEKLWYIPIDYIKHYLSCSEGVVSVALGTYYYAGNLPISPEEIESVAKIIRTRLDQKGFVTDTELERLIRDNCPSTAINTAFLSARGLRNSLAFYLRDRFSFNGTIISEHGRQLNMIQMFEMFCESRERMTVDELRAFVKGMNTNISNVYLEAVFNKMLRISQTEFIKKDAVSFNIPDIDAALDQLIEGDYAPLKSFALFLHFPPVSVKWNKFLLEGYVAQFSRDFTLLHASYTMSECCGAIVRKTSHIKDFKSLITDVLANDGGWQNRTEALAVLTREGYLQNGRYSEIDSVVAEARLRREALLAAKGNQY